MNVTSRVNYQALPADSAFTNRIMFELIGDELTSGRKAPLNIVMAIDTSGSMQGDKITKAKEAAKMIVRLLEPHDIFSLVTFNNVVETIVPVAKGADLAGVESMIDKIVAGGGTNFSGGYERAYELACDAVHIATTRIILLTDGQANVGITSRDELSIIARKFRDQQITTTCFGVGEDFDELLLTLMAEAGGGSSNFIRYPQHAAEVFRGELGDLRSITAINTRIRFSPSVYVTSHTLLNDFPNDGTGSSLVGDIYGTKERRAVLELEIKTGAQTADLPIGKFEITYDIPGKGTTVPITLPLSIPVVSKDEFFKYQADDEVTLEAALLTVGRGKREAMQLACNSKFIEAADLLDRYLAVLVALNLNDAELDSELEQLKERSWNLRHRGAEFFTATEKKYMTFEADMTMKGKKEMYRAMLARKNRAFPDEDKSSIIVRSCFDGREFAVGSNFPTVADFLKDVFVKLDGAVKPNSYGRDYFIKDEISSRAYDMGSSYCKANNIPKDIRKLNEIGIHSGMTLEVVPLPPIKIARQQGITSAVVRIDLSLLGQGKKSFIDIKCTPTTIACDFLAAVYDEIKDLVPPNSLGRCWIIRNTTNGRIFDWGSSWSRFHNMQADVRPIDKVGIKGGSLLQVVMLRIERR